MFDMIIEFVDWILIEDEFVKGLWFVYEMNIIKEWYWWKRISWMKLKIDVIKIVIL